MRTMRSAMLALAAALAAGPAAALEPTHSATVALVGTVTGSPESVAFSGEAKVTSRLAPDPDFGSPRLVLTVDLSALTGVGADTLKKYVVTAERVVQRRLASTQELRLTFPFKAEASPETVLARSGLASLALTIDTATGAVTAASGSVGSLPQ